MKKHLVYIFILLAFVSCEKDSEKSSEAFVESVSLEAGLLDVYKTSIDNNSKEIVIHTMSALSQINYPFTINLDINPSKGASLTENTTSVTFNYPYEAVVFSVESEDAKTKNDFVLRLQDKQIPNADFEQWYEVTGSNGKTFHDPGLSEFNTVWATANMGSSLSGVQTTVPVAFKNGSDIAPKITTVSTAIVPLISGTVFIGKFNLNGAMTEPTNPEAAANLGMPFVFKPKAIRFKYMYTPGAQLVKATLKEEGNLFGGFDVEHLDGVDQFGVAAVLERRVGDEVTVIAKGTVESSRSSSMLDFRYLPLEYFSNEEPTHFHISFSSSYGGFNYTGAVNSTLYIDDIVLLYE